MDNLEKRLGAVVRARRIHLELEQEAFADKAGLHRTHVSMIERSLGSPTLAVIEKPEVALSTSMASLLAEVEADTVSRSMSTGTPLPQRSANDGAGPILGPR